MLNEIYHIAVQVLIDEKSDVFHYNKYLLTQMVVGCFLFIQNPSW